MRIIDVSLEMVKSRREQKRQWLKVVIIWETCTCFTKDGEEKGKF